MQRTILATTYPKDNPDLALKDKVERLRRYHAVSGGKSDRETDDRYSFKTSSVGKTFVNKIQGRSSNIILLN